MKGGKHMLTTNTNYNTPRQCPVYNKEINSELCLDTILAMTKSIKLTCVKELENIKSIESARKACANCPYSDL